MGADDFEEREKKLRDRLNAQADALTKHRSKDREFHGLEREFHYHQAQMLADYERSKDVKHPRDVGTVREQILRRFLATSGHPFVQRVVAELGAELNPNGAPNAHGVGGTRPGLWWHAVDLITAGKWRELIETQRFTTAEDIADAVAYGLDYSPHDATRPGYLTTTGARELMRGIGADEPKDPVALLLNMAAPTSSRADKGAERWPINARHETDETTERKANKVSKS